MFCYTTARRALFERSEFARPMYSNYNLLANEVQGAGFFLTAFFARQKKAVNLKLKIKSKKLHQHIMLTDNIFIILFMKKRGHKALLSGIKNSWKYEKDTFI